MAKAKVGATLTLNTIDTPMTKAVKEKGKVFLAIIKKEKEKGPTKVQDNDNVPKQLTLTAKRRDTKLANAANVYMTRSMVLKNRNKPTTLNTLNPLRFNLWRLRKKRH